MFYPSRKEFKQLAKKGNLIPVYQEIVSDTETPVSAFHKIESDYSFLLESIEGGENIARYSFLAADPLVVFKSKGNKIEISHGNKIKIMTGNPFKHLKSIIQQYKPVKLPALPRFHGGWVGYIGYDAVRFIERVPNKNPDVLKIPDIQMMLTDTIIAFDRVKHKIIIISNAFVGKSADQAYADAISKIKKLANKILHNDKIARLRHGKKPVMRKTPLHSNMSEAQYQEAVKKAKQHIRAGDIIQVVPSLRFRLKTSKNPFEIYRQLRTINPSPYMYYLSFGAVKLVGASPEVMVRLENHVATLRPIAGTRPRGANEKEDLKLMRELLSSVKEKAEHLMLVDLGRNDLGRVCEPGSVKVNDYMTVEKYSHVMHIVSQVNGRLSPHKDAFDLFTACFPAGTVTGAPKIRAMEIIDELENEQRGAYAGAIGYFTFSGDLDTCINIRTIVMQGNSAYIQAGAGIVSDSNPKKELKEVQDKARALFKAIENAGA